MAIPRIEGVLLPERIVLRPHEGAEGPPKAEPGVEPGVEMVRSEHYASWIEVSVPEPMYVDITWSLSQAGRYTLGNGVRWCGWPLYHVFDRERVQFDWRVQGPAQPEITRLRLCLTVTDGWNGRHTARRRPAIPVELELEVQGWRRWAPWLGRLRHTS